MLHDADAQPSLETVQCADGDIQLLPGESSGQLDVCVSKRWAAVCFSEWTHSGAAVACRQLGYDGGKMREIYIMMCTHFYKVGLVLLSLKIMQYSQ